ncbi:MAG TPA: GTPase Era [Myxococcota bacterium]|nr:GTPase Era [Myxococcota bacterium]
MGEAGSGHRSGVVALLGRPNVGKSTLLNHLLGEKLAIVTSRPQTTRSRVLGILSRPDAQLLLVDTPGLHGGSRPLDRAMRAAAEEAAGDCDVALVLVDPARPPAPGADEWLAGLLAGGKPALVVATRIDRPEIAAAPWPPPGVDPSAALRVSAHTGEGVAALLEAVVQRLPLAPPYYPSDQLSDRPARFFAAEAVREAAFELLAQELPYEVAAEVLDFDESDPRLVRIQANLLVRRESQKRIAVGRGGEVVKAIGVRARQALEQQLGSRVYLGLRVKVEPDWAKHPKRLKSLGYH